MIILRLRRNLKRRQNQTEIESPTRTAQDTVIDDSYARLVQRILLCPECGWSYDYHDDGACPNAEQQATLIAWELRHLS